MLDDNKGIRQENINQCKDDKEILKSKPKTHIENMRESAACRSIKIIPKEITC